MFSSNQRFQDARNYQQANQSLPQFRPQAMSMNLPNSSSMMQDTNLFTEETVQPSQSYYSHYQPQHSNLKVDSLFVSNTQHSQQQSAQKTPVDNRIKSEKFFKELQSIFTNQLDRIKEGLVEDLKTMKLSEDGVRKAISSNYEQLTDNITDLKSDVRNAVKAFGKKIEDAYKDQEAELDRLSSTLRHQKTTGKNKANLDSLEGSLKELFVNLTFELEGLKGELATMKQNMEQDRDHIRGLSQTCSVGANRLDELITAENKNHIKFMQHLLEEKAARSRAGNAAASTSKRSITINSKHNTPSKSLQRASKARAKATPSGQTSEEAALFQQLMLPMYHKIFSSFLSMRNQRMDIIDEKQKLEAQLAQLNTKQNNTDQDLQREADLSEEIRKLSYQCQRATCYLKHRRRDINKCYMTKYPHAGFTQFKPLLEFEHNRRFYPEDFNFRRDDLDEEPAKRSDIRMDIESRTSNFRLSNRSKQSSVDRNVFSKQSSFGDLNPRLSYLASLFTPQACDEEENLNEDGEDEEGGSCKDREQSGGSSSKRDCPSPAIEEPEPEQKPAPDKALQSATTKKRGRKPKSVQPQELLEHASKSVRIMRVKVAVSTPS